MKAIKQAVVRLLNRAVADYLRRNKVKVIAVAGSIGKTSTANAIRVILAQKYKVHQPKTAYNTNKSVHLELFDLPFATSAIGWAKTLLTLLLRSRGKAPYEVVVIEVGIDHPAEMPSFAWLRPQVGVLTAIAPEHMEYFKTIEAVAEEELAMGEFCDELLFNTNTVDERFLSDDMKARARWYQSGDYRADNYRVQDNKVLADFLVAGERLPDVELQILGEHSLDALVAAAAVGAQQDLDQQQIAAGLRAVEPVKGRMQRLSGAKGSIIIDDSYNASPQAAKAALDVLVQFVAPQHVAVLGMMNEMGEYSLQAHTEVGEYCDPAKLDLVVTIGPDANEYLAAAAEKRGCKVERFTNPYMAGEFIKQQLKPGAAVLFKGSQNGVFAEEAIKAVLADPADKDRLVRQSAYWMKRKQAQFKPPDEAHAV
jgi:UDP-N-acetylmuramoyl-tripeptide--D-alanyl-D-alanine ligase